MRYDLNRIAEVCGGELAGENSVVEGVCTDSRSSCRGGTLFVAIRGGNHDGHDYIGELYRRGVRAFMVETLPAEQLPQAGFVVVRRSVEALQALAADYRAGYGGTVVAIAGSNGKTIVKEWIAQLAPPGVKLFRSPKSYNSQTGVALSVLMMDGDEQAAIFEAGVSLPDEMGWLERILRPDVGVFTNIGDAHQENFASVEEKLAEKLNLFVGAKQIIYSDPRVGDELRRRFPRAQATEARQYEKLFPEGDPTWRQNGSLAVAVCAALGLEGAGRRVGELQPVAMRLEVREGINGSIIVNDFYNSDINSLSIALDYLRNVAADRPRTLILSDILQSGMDDEQLYARVARMVAASGVERVTAIGSRIAGRDLGAPTDHYPTTESYLAAVRRSDVARRAILVKGNRAAQFETLSHALQLKSHTTALEVDLDAMIHNLNVFRALVGKRTRLMAMVKASGYGHGDHEVAAMLQNQGVDYLAVAFADEGVALRERGISTPIVTLNADEDSFDLMIGHRLEPEIYSFHSLGLFVATAARHGERSYPVHIKLDVGMHRLGFVASEIAALGEAVASAGRLIRVETVFAHLPAADDPAKDDLTRSQIALFNKLCAELGDRLGYAPLRHIANSAAIERFPEARMDLCRLGIGLYGISGQLPLRHVATLRSRIVQIKDIPAGEGIGYGCEGRGPARIATVPAGYADGLDRHLGLGRWAMSANGHRVPTIGRICMDTCMIDITGVDAEEGDDVTIFGDEDGLRVADMARVLDTIPYEVMTSVSARIKRIFIKE
ncbi:MAG: alanine racemase [Rikenellaceae bacterium]|jgi:alanine racemase|nr:alanine racemase [Rikenellaceae bacterium]